MKRLFTCVASAAMLLTSIFCLAHESEGKQSISQSANSAYKEQLVKAKKNDQAALAQWESRLTQLSMNQAGLKSFADYGKPGEDPTYVGRFASAPSDYESDRSECLREISMLKSNIAYYDQELARIRKDAETASGTGGANFWKAASKTKEDDGKSGGGFMFAEDKSSRPLWLNGSWSPHDSRHAYRITILDDSRLLWETVYYAGFNGFSIDPPPHKTGVAHGFERPYEYRNTGSVFLPAVGPLTLADKVYGGTVKEGDSVSIEPGKKNPWHDGRDAAQFIYTNANGKNYDRRRYKRTEEP